MFPSRVIGIVIAGAVIVAIASHIWYNPATRYLAMSLVGLFVGLFAFLLVTLWGQIFDVIHAIEWTERRPAALVILATVFIVAAIAAAVKGFAWIAVTVLIALGFLGFTAGLVYVCGLVF